MNSATLNLELQHISKRFGQEEILSQLSYTFSQPSSTALLGINGSGKSTLLQIIAGYTNPTKGKVIFEVDGKMLEQADMYKQVSYCAPYLELIEEMTLTEFLTYHFAFKKAMIPVPEIIKHIGLETSSHKLISNFSSGMKQRVKLAQAILADTNVLLLDEPCTNLDEEGIQLYKSLLREFAPQRIIIVASNDKNEYDVCSTHLKIADFKPSHHDRTRSA